MPLLPTRMSSALAAAVFFSHSEKSSLMVRFNFFCVISGERVQNALVAISGKHFLMACRT